MLSISCGFLYCHFPTPYVRGDCFQSKDEFGASHLLDEHATTELPPPDLFLLLILAQSLIKLFRKALNLRCCCLSHQNHCNHSREPPFLTAV